jgi:hypothetical protein
MLTVRPQVDYSSEPIPQGRSKPVLGDLVCVAGNVCWVTIAFHFYDKMVVSVRAAPMNDDVRPSHSVVHLDDVNVTIIFRT